MFVYDPNNDSNPPIPDVHPVMMSYWNIFPESLHKLFCESFTKGLHNPEARVMDKEWRREMVSLRDSMFECPDCEAENFSTSIE